MGGEAAKGPLEPHESKAPAPWVTLEAFRALYTAEMRQELLEATLALRRERLAKLVAEGMAPDDADIESHRMGAVGRGALQLIAGLHPPDYTW
jgi:hypothetical protein